MRPIKAAVVAKAPAGDFNLDTRPMKYFDAGIDPRSMREQERELKAVTYQGK